MQMRTVTVEIIDAFVDQGAGGNAAGLVMEQAAELSPAQRQEVARQLGVSEVAFVLPSRSADYRLEFYTPARPIPHCGHATVAAFARLAQTGRLARDEAVNETVDGPRRIRIEGGQAFLQQVPARAAALDPAAAGEVLDSLGISAEQLLPGGGPFLAHNGNGSVQIGLADGEVLASLRLDMARIEAVTRRLDAVCYYVFSLETAQPGRDASARMFGPAYGIPEEAATGMAAGPLACWLEQRTGGQRRELRIEQGHLMRPPSPSLILARPERQGQGLAAMWIGGSARMRGSREIPLEG
jgi:PhzF family phenazine biosynthesis protein